MKLSDELKQSCEGNVTKEECIKAVKTFKCNKSPGNDGITIEFYKKFWPKLETVLIDSLNFSFEQGELSVTQRQAVITLIEKQGKDRNLIKNWRPISLLNVDYKILTKVLALRIKSILPEIINRNQTGYC